MDWRDMLYVNVANAVSLSCGSQIIFTVASSFGVGVDDGTMEQNQLMAQEESLPGSTAFGLAERVFQDDAELVTGDYYFPFVIRPFAGMYKTWTEMFGNCVSQHVVWPEDV